MDIKDKSLVKKIMWIILYHIPLFGMFIVISNLRWFCEYREWFVLYQFVILILLLLLGFFYYTPIENIANTCFLI